MSGGNALAISGAGHLSYIDHNAAPLTAGSGGDGLSISSTGDNGATPGAVTVETGGAITGEYGIYASNEGTGAISVTATGQVTGTSLNGIWVQNAATAGDLTVNAATVSGSDTGIFASNNGTGTTSVTASGQVTAGDGGIYARNDTTARDLTVNAASVTGGKTGIVVNNAGIGATSVSATGQVTGTSRNGIWVQNAATAGDLTVNAADVSGGETGIYASNNGTGATTVTASGQVSGTIGGGIQAENNNTATDLTVNAASVTSDWIGIHASNEGTGATRVTATGEVSGTNGNGIGAVNGSTATDLTVNAADVSGGDTGIYAANAGTGATVVTASGQVTGSNGGGIWALNRATATDLTVNAAGDTSGDTGIYASNAGTGATSVSATDQVTGTGGRGIYARNDTTATNLTVNVAGVSGGTTGIFASNAGIGATTVTASGHVAGTGGRGIYARNDTTATNLTVNVAGVSGRDTGIFASNAGIGATTVTASGHVAGISGDGIWAENGATATDLTVNAASVTGVVGISASNAGTGATSVTATGQVTGTGFFGIYADTVSSATALTVNAASVTGATTGISASNAGTGATSVTATGKVTGTSLNGIWVQNAATATDLTVTAASVTGGDTGIYAHNNGTGTTSVIATGKVIGAFYGIDAFNDSTATDLTVNAAGVSGGNVGIVVNNAGTGITSVTATGQVTGTAGNGISAENGATATNLTVNIASVIGRNTGISASNAGTGATSVTATGQVTGSNLNGIGVQNAATATNLTVNAASVTGGDTGIYAYNHGTGTTSVTATGQVIGAFYGIDAFNDSTATDLTVNAASATGDLAGIYASNEGTGVTSVTAKGEVSGTSGSGIEAYNGSAAGDLTMNVAGVSGRNTGIIASNEGSGATEVIATGQVTGTSLNGIWVQNAATATDLTVNAASATGGDTGIYAYNNGTGTTSVTTTGQVIGAFYGIDAFNDSTATDLTVNAAGVSGGNVGIVANNTGTGTTSITTGGLVEGGTSAISATSAGQTITITINGLVRNLSQLPTGLAIETSGGPVALTNAGGMIGRISFGTGANTMSNNAAWNTAGGVNAFGGGSLTNSASGTIVAAGDGALPVTTVFDGLGSFVNRGVLTMANGIAGDTVSQTGGNARFEAGSVLAIDLNAAGEADKFTTTGNATLTGGTVSVTKAGGVYLPGSHWTILHATGGVSGAFAPLTEDMPYVDLSLGYDANDVYLDSRRNAVAFCLDGFSRNECATANGVESIGQGNSLYDLVASQTSAQAAAYAFDQLSGEIHASAKTVLIEDSRFVREAAIDRLRSAFDAVGAVQMPVMSYAERGPVLAPATTDRLAVWGRGFGAWGSWNSDGNVARLKRSTGGLLMGIDAPLDTWRFGLLAGYSYTSFDVKDRNSGGTSQNYHLGLYGGSQWGDLAFRSGAAYTWHDLSFSRSISFPGFSDQLDSNYNAGTAQVFGELGYGLHAGSIMLEPFANLAYVNLSTDGFTERGAAAALTGASATTDATFTTIGVHASTSLDLGGINATARGTLGWRHTLGDVTPLATLSFAGGSPFSIAGVPIAKDAAVIDAGLDFAISSNAALGLSYSGQFGSGVTDQSVSATFNMKF